ncbi:SGNH/GDSL hydrolase family protein [Cerasicoccus fimbriatus]|uniref:SGNH/GDSL hydrolase family protein n=1 Tax=Cerasicoccus fimbriatus TaxID=3014554 RepID=UPI0022B57EC5|nr:SGNH/GDSL hydrolase family protein [Cerasicoccus sp. TK19100]
MAILQCRFHGSGHMPEYFMTKQSQHPISILFIGDSITDCDRRTQHQPLGNGYVKLIDDMFKVHHPECQVKIINRGLGGNTMDDLRSRWTDHVLCEEPDWIVLKVGINDCNRHVTDSAANPLQSPEQYAEILDHLMGYTRQALPDAKVLIVSPFYISQDMDLPGSYRARIRKTLDAYIEANEVAAKKFHTEYLNLNAAFLTLSKYYKPCYLAEDAVHPNSTGTLFIATKLYKILESALGLVELEHHSVELKTVDL